MKVLFFLSLLGFCHAVFATYWMLIGNPSNFLIEKIHYLHASTGLFVNRAVFATFLVLCAFSALYYMTIFFQKNKITNFGFFEQINTKIIYLRIFIIFLTVGILTTWSRIANLSYVLVLISFLIYSKISFKKYINPLSTIILFILAFDILILGLVFGNSKLIERYAETSLVGEALRFEFHEFGLAQFKKFWLFGYGSGAFEIVYKLFSNGLHGIATHAHHDGIELMGEVGILGILILFLLSIIYFKKLVNNIRDDRVLARFFLISSLLLILFIQSFVDYSLHIPGISTLLAVILSVGLVNFRKANT
jgi:O-antigen ligase